MQLAFMLGSSLWYLLKQGTTWNNLQQTRNDLKWPTTTYNKQEMTWNDLQQPEKTYNEQEMTWKRPTASKKQPEMTHNE